MYCVRCGVELADSELICPLCKTKVYHPDIPCGKGEALYPENRYPRERKRSLLPQILLCAAFLLPILIVLLCDMQFNGSITWSGIVIGALLLGYVIFVLPTWFKKPNPVIFAPCDFLLCGIYLFYIELITEGEWFLSFAFPVVGCICAIVTAVIALMRYVPKGRFFIFGGAFIALGGAVLLMEFLMCFTFKNIRFIGWSLYPLVTLIFLGGILIFLGICRPARESMEKKFYI